MIPSEALQIHRDDQARLEALRMTIQAGEESGIAEGDVFEQVRGYIRQLAAEMGNVAEG